MRIKYKDRDYDDREDDFEDFFAATLDGRSDNQLSCVITNADNNSRAIGRLCELLAKKGILTFAEAVSVSGTRLEVQEAE